MALSLDQIKTLADALKPRDADTMDTRIHRCVAGEHLDTYLKLTQELSMHRGVEALLMTKRIDRVRGDLLAQLDIVAGISPDMVPLALAAHEALSKSVQQGR